MRNFFQYVVYSVYIGVYCIIILNCNQSRISLKTYKQLLILIYKLNFKMFLLTTLICYYFYVFKRSGCRFNTY